MVESLQCRQLTNTSLRFYLQWGKWLIKAKIVTGCTSQPQVCVLQCAGNIDTINVKSVVTQQNTARLLQLAHRMAGGDAFDGILDIQGLHISVASTLTVKEAVKEAGDVPNLAERVIEILSINEHQQAVVVKETSKQAASSLWRQHRTGRVTASVAANCAAAVRNNRVARHADIARVMGYYGSASSVAMSWGTDQEKVAIERYVEFHKDVCDTEAVSCTATGLWISTQHPYIAASPDGIVNCECCGQGLLEVKNPYTYRTSPIQHYAFQKESCLAEENGTFHLIHSHPYYVQVQIQLFCTGFKWCDFVVKTVSEENNFNMERIYVDQELMTRLLPRLKVFFCEGIVPEFVSGSVKNKVVNKAVKKTMDSMLSTLEAKS